MLPAVFFVRPPRKQTDCTINSFSAKVSRDKTFVIRTDSIRQYIKYRVSPWDLNLCSMKPSLWKTFLLRSLIEMASNPTAFLVLPLETAAYTLIARSVAAGLLLLQMISSRVHCVSKRGREFLDRYTSVRMLVPIASSQTKRSVLQAPTNFELSLKSYARKTRGRSSR